MEEANTLLMNLENFFRYSPAQFDIVRHILVLGVGAQVVGLVYFLTTRSNLSPRYRVTSTVSAVVMVSAALILLNQQMVWNTAFDWNGNTWERSTDVFSNGFRYVNWSIDVPMLLTSLLIALGLRGQEFRRQWTVLTFTSLAMIWLGYVGQFYETTDYLRLYVWGAASTVFMVFVVYRVAMLIFGNLRHMPTSRTRSLLRGVFFLLLCSWTLYPVGYLLPHLYPDAWGMVLRQVLFTIADITSKVVYGVLISQLCLLRSRAEGYPAAQEVPVV